MKKPSKVKPIQKGEPKFRYNSICCNSPATKAPCAFVGMKSKEAETQGLGTFRCISCQKPCKCTRIKNVLDKKSES